MNSDNPTISSVYLIERPVLPKKTLEKHSDTISKFEDRFLSERVKELEKSIKVPAGVGEAPITLPSLDLGQIVAEERAKFLRFLPKLLPLLITYGMRVFSPPYDNGWQTGTGSPLAHWDGRPLSMATDGGSSSGFCIYISSPTSVFATVTFHGTYKFNWSSFDDRPSSSVTGGLGTCIYKGSNAAPALIRRSTLFSVRGSRAFTGEQGEGQLPTVLTSPSGPSPNTFASYLLPVSLLMEPSVTYAIWLWCWHAAVGTTKAPFISFVACDVPAVTVSMSEPYFPR